ARFRRRIRPPCGRAAATALPVAVSGFCRSGNRPYRPSAARSGRSGECLQAPGAAPGRTAGGRPAPPPRRDSRHWKGYRRRRPHRRRGLHVLRDRRPHGDPQRSRHSVRLHDCGSRLPERRRGSWLRDDGLSAGGRGAGSPSLSGPGIRSHRRVHRNSYRRTHRQAQGSVMMLRRIVPPSSSPMMKPILLGLALLMAATTAQDADAQRVRISGIKKYAQVTTGDLTIPAGSTSSGSVMAIRGDVNVYGNVDGAATSVLGDVIVHEGGRVRGGAVALGGHVRNEGGSILGVIKDVGTTHNRSTISFGGRPRTTLGSLVSAFILLIVLLQVGTL